MTTPADTDEMLRFAVMDEDDLKVMSAHLQDSRVATEDMAYLKGSGRFAVVASRIDWQAFVRGEQRRRHAGFHFERVMRVQRSGFDQGAKEPLQLLAIAFHPTVAPSGEVVLTFAGGRMIRLEVECLEAEMRDLSPCWPVHDCPHHRLDEAEPAR